MDGPMNGPLNIKPTERYQYNGEEYEIVDVDGDRVQLRSLQQSRTIIFQTMDKLIRAWQKGHLRRTQEAPFAPSATSISTALSTSHNATLMKRLAYLLPVLEEFGGHLPRPEVKRLLSEIAVQRGDARAPSYETLYLWKRAYLAAGELSLALVPKGRHRTLHRLHNQPEEIQQLIRLNVDQLYFTRTPCSQTELIQAIQCAVGACNRTRDPLHQLQEPSTTTLYRIICELDRFETDVHHLGFHDAAMRQKWSKKRRRPYRRFDLVEGDSHELDIETCDAFGNPVGRPWLTALIEVRDRVIVGWDLSYNPPSLEKTIRGLKCSMLAENPYGGTAVRYRVDNGSEFIAKRLKQILSGVGSDINYSAPGTPDQKPHIESFFKTWTLPIVHCMRGTTFSTHTGYDSEANAICTLEVLRHRFKDWLESVYHASFHSGLKMSPKRHG
jgi:putative transposase